MYYVYVIYDKNIDKFYIGFTNNIKRRTEEHFRGNAVTTSKMKNKALVYFEGCISKKDN